MDYGAIEKVTEAEYKYDAANRLISYNGKEVQYDKDGNMVYGPLNGEMVQYEYDCRNRLVKAGNTRYEYDAENNRIAVETAECREEYFVNTNAELSQVLTATRYEKNATGYSRGGETTTYTYGNGLVSQYTDDKGMEYYHYNNIGSTMYLTKNGVKTHEFAYSTYGELTLGEYGEVRFLYNGQFGVATDDNGLYYMRARYYNPEIRRFINQDIVIGSIENSQSLNRYAYCQGNPVNYLDPFGLEPCEFFSGLGHSVLNILGLIPGIGDVFDIANAIWYFSEGKVGRGIEAGIAALPFIGNFFPNTRMFNYTKRVLNIVSYGGTACLAGQGMISGGQFLWAEINSGHCSGWNIALGIANIGLNGMAFFLSGKGLVRNVKELDYLNMTYIAQKAKWSDIDGGPELTKLLEDVVVNDSSSGKSCKFSRTSGTLPEFNLQFFASSYTESENLKIIKKIMQEGEISSNGRRIVNNLDDNTRIVFGLDIGDNAHPLRNHGYMEPVNHMNIEIQKISDSGNVYTKWDMHMILDKNNNIIKTIITGPWKDIK